MTHLAIIVAFSFAVIGVTVQAVKICSSSELASDRATRLVGLSAYVLIIVGLWPLVWGGVSGP